MLSPTNPDEKTAFDFINSLQGKSQEDIHQALVEFISIGRNINAPCDSVMGSTLLAYAARSGNLILMQELIAMGANARNVDGAFHTLLHVSVNSNHLDCIEYALTQLSQEDLGLTNSDGQTALHAACRTDNPDVLKRLLQNKEIQKQKDKIDLYGRKPLDIAIENKCDEVIRLLMNDPQCDVTQFPHYGKPMLNLSQENLESQLKTYLDITDRSDISEQIIFKFGMCNGWSLLNQIFFNMGRKDELKDIYKLIASWDRSKESLDNQDLPPTLKAYYQKTFKERNEPGDLKFVFELLISYLGIAFSDTKNVEDLALGLKQSDREKQYELLKAKDGPELTRIFTFPNVNINKQQLKEIFDLLSQWPSLSVDIWYKGHAVSLQVLADGTLDYSDSGFLNTLAHPFSAEQLSDHMLKTNDKFDFAFTAFRFDAPGRPLPQIVYPAFNPDFVKQNNFTPLHFAVVCNNPTEVERIAKSNPTLLTHLDAYGFTPLTRALHSHHEACFLALLDAHAKLSLPNQLDFSAQPLSYEKMVENNYVSPPSVIDTKDLNFLVGLVEAGKLDPYFSDDLGRSLLDAVKYMPEMVQIIEKQRALVKEKKQAATERKDLTFRSPLDKPSDSMKQTQETPKDPSQAIKNKK